MKLALAVVVVALGVAAGDVAPVLADRWPADALERLDREYH